MIKICDKAFLCEYGENKKPYSHGGSETLRVGADVQACTALGGDCCHPREAHAHVRRVHARKVVQKKIAKVKKA